MPKTKPATLTETLEALAAGQAAAEANQHVRSCPYKTTGPDDEHGRYLQLTWARAYRETQALLRSQEAEDPTAVAEGTDRESAGQ